MRSMINHKKVLVVALNGPAVGAGAAWFPPVADIVLASKSSYLQTPFSRLGLVPEFGSAVNFASSTGVHRANDFFMFGRKYSVEELTQWGIVNRVFPAADFHQSVQAFLEEQLRVNDGKSMMEVKRLQNAPLRDQRLLAVHEAADALAERFVEDAPTKRFQQQRDMLRGEFPGNYPIQFTIRKLTGQQRNPSRKRAKLSYEQLWSIVFWPGCRVVCTSKRSWGNKERDASPLGRVTARDMVVVLTPLTLYPTCSSTTRTKNDLASRKTQTVSV